MGFSCALVSQRTLLFYLQYKWLYFHFWSWGKLSDKLATSGHKVEVMASSVPQKGILGPAHLLYMWYIATEQLLNRSHQEQHVEPQENKGTERCKKHVNGDISTLGWKVLSVL